MSSRGETPRRSQDPPLGSCDATLQKSPHRRLRELIPEAEMEADRSDASSQLPAAECRVEAGEGLPINPTE